MHFEGFERHECTVNSNELARHARALQRSKHQLLFHYRKNPQLGNETQSPLKGPQLVGFPITLNCVGACGFQT